MKRTPSQVTGEKGEDIFPSLLPRCFTVNTMRRDFGLDFILQHFNEDGKATGNFTFVQVKSCEKETSSKKHIAVVLDVEAVKHYVDEITDLPVFLVAIDVKNRRGYWLFLQRHLRVNEKRKWRDQRSITIRIPVANELAPDGEPAKKFEEAVKDAWSDMLALGISHPRDLFEAEKRFFESLDPRFDVGVKHGARETELTLNAKQGKPFVFEMRASGDEAASRFKRAFETGRLTEFRPGDLTITGSPILDFLLSSGHGLQSIQIGLPSVLQMKIRVLDREGREQSHLDPFDVTVTRGQREYALDGRLGQSPISINMTLPLASEETTFSKPLPGFVNLEQWNGQEVLRMAYFTQIRRLFAELEKSDASLDVALSKEGNESHLCKIDWKLEDVKIVNKALDIYDKARAIAERFSLNCQMQAPTIDVVEEIERLYELVIERKSIPEPFSGVTMTVRRSAALTFFEAIRNDETHQPLVLKGTCSLPFLGHQVDVGGVDISISNWDLANMDEIESHLDNGAEEVTVEILRTTESDVTITLNEAP